MLLPAQGNKTDPSDSPGRRHLVGRRPGGDGLRKTQRKRKITQQGHKGHEGSDLQVPFERSVFLAFVSFLFKFFRSSASWGEFFRFFSFLGVPGNAGLGHDLGLAP